MQRFFRVIAVDGLGALQAKGTLLEFDPETYAAARSLCNYKNSEQKHLTYKTQIQHLTLVK